MMEKKSLEILYFKYLKNKIKSLINLKKNLISFNK